MNNQTVYWLWIQQLIGYSSNKITRILETFTFAEEFYRASLKDKLSCRCFRKNDIPKLEDLSLDKAYEIMKRCEECGIEIVTIGDAAYPQRLVNIPSPPVALFVRGRTEVLADDFSVAMVGTRTATQEGKRNAFDFGYGLAKNGVTIVSGGALGIDTYSHKGALRADGKTLCVLGCGLEYRYLPENDGMKREILCRGAVISEYPPDYPSSRFTFPQRNRIISGLSRGVIVVEAGGRSGSLITARVALEQNRDIFAIPGDISKDVAFGTNRLIKDGAVPITNIYDVLDYYKGVSFEGIQRDYIGKPMTIFDFENNKEIFSEEEKIGKAPERSGSPKTIKSYRRRTVGGITKAKGTREEIKAEEKNRISEKLPLDNKADFESLSENANKVVRAFDSGKLHIDRLVERTGLSVAAIHSAVTELEISGFVESLEGRFYRLLVSVE